MDETTHLLVSLIEKMVVVVAFVDLFSRTGLYQRVFEKKLSFSDQLTLIVVFGLFSIFGTLAGEPFKGVYINVRDMGPAVAGLLGGPLVGLGAGLIGGIHRFTLGGLTCNACSLATIIVGLVGGLIHFYRHGQLISIWGVLLFAVLGESFHMGLSLLLSRPFDQALAAVRVAALPMIFNNSLGGALSILIMSDMNKRLAEDKKLEQKLASIIRRE